MINQHLISATLVGLLVGCGSDDDSTNTSTESPKVVFPLGHSTTTSDTILVKGTITDDLRALAINGVEADFNQSEEFWFAEVPVNAEEITELSLAYEDNNGNYDIDTGVTVEKSKYYLQSVGTGKSVEYDNTVYINETDSRTIFSMNKDGSNIRPLWYYGDHDIEGVNRINIEDNMRVSEDGSKIYLIIYGWNSSLDTDIAQITELDTSTGNISILYGPESQGYSEFNFGHMAYLEELGTSGSLVLTNSGTNRIPYIFDIQSQTMSTMNIDALNDLTGGIVYTRIFHLSATETGNLRVIGISGTTSNREFWNGEMDLTACNGEDESCRLTVSNLNSGSSFEGCSSPLDSLGYANYHEASERWIYTSFSNSFTQLCALNLSDYTIESATLETEFTEYRNSISLTDSSIFVSLSGRTILSGDLPSNFDGTVVNLTAFNEVPTIGDPSIIPSTPREIRFNNSTNEGYWIDRALGKVFQLNFDNWEWSTIFELADEVLEEGQEATRPEFQPEESALDEENGTLYLVSDNQQSIFSINLETREYEIVVAHDSEGENAFDIYDLDSIAFDNQRGLLYIANRRLSDVSREDETRLNLLAFNVDTKEITEISSDVLIADHPLQDGIKASYDMSYDSTNNRVLFYASESDENYPIWAIDVTTGERSIVSFEYDSDWTEQECLDEMSVELCAKTELIDQPRTSNARGQEMDEENNRMLIASQDSASILSMDATSGVITNISPEEYSYGPLLTQPKGIDLISNSNVAVVADEGIDGLFLVDTDTGHRVLIHNR